MSSGDNKNMRDGFVVKTRSKGRLFGDMLGGLFGSGAPVPSAIPTSNQFAALGDHGDEQKMSVASQGLELLGNVAKHLHHFS